MACFPQLSSGALGQYPIRKRNACRTIRNQCLDGRDIKLADPAASKTDWALTFQELTDGEIDAMRDFFVSMEGSLNSFSFLDPTDNLLVWSEQFDQAAWQKDALLQLTSGVADPLGRSSAFHVVNTGGATQGLTQTLNVPERYYYAFSLWVRGQAGAVTLRRGGETSVLAVDMNWNRLVLACESGGTDETVAFGIQFVPGASVDLFGAQVEAQIGASGYKKTTSRGGVYPITRFAEDGLVLSTIGPGRHGCLVHLRS
jgi:hypothetical protein